MTEDTAFQPLGRMGKSAWGWVLAYGILGVTGGELGLTDVSAKAVGIALFGPYVLAVELASILLLAGLVTAYHLGREDKSGEVLSVPRTPARPSQEGGQQ